MNRRPSLQLFNMILQHLAAAWTAQHLQRFSFNLACPLPGNTEILSHFPRRTLTTIFETKPELDDTTFLRSQLGQSTFDLLLEHGFGQLSFL